MTAFKIKYQLRRKACQSIPQGDWQDKEYIVVTDEDATNAVIELMIATFDHHETRLRGVEAISEIDYISLEEI